MYFFGQGHIMKQLDSILPWLYEDTSRSMNILIRGPSGWGKTRMAFMICNYLTGGKFEYCLGDNLVFNTKQRVHFIDEVHLLKDPEPLYPLMDEGKYVIILATNDVDILKEALSNRCTQMYTVYILGILSSRIESYSPTGTTVQRSVGISGLHNRER